MLTPATKAMMSRLMQDFPLYARECLVIRTKAGTIEPLILNRAQRYIHGLLEKQLRAKGMVRAMILKGRQQGCSTYIGARFYRKTSWQRGVRTFILAHRDDATDNLFRMTKRFHDNFPEALRPSTSYSSRKELVFNVMQSSYGLGTAKSGGVGRSDTVQLFHGSEVGFWDNAEDIVSGALQAVPNEPGTEVIQESTANGMGNYFHQQWQDAETGRSPYIAVFVPWYWQPEYRMAAEPGFALESEEEEYKRLYGLDSEQMAWRRAKIIELKDPLLFRQEYPATAAEAFQVTGHDSFIRPEIVMRARRQKVTDRVGPVVAGVDPARFGDDGTGIVERQGRSLLRRETVYKLDTMQVVGRCKVLLDRSTDRIAKMFIDVGGLGAGVVDRLRELGYGERAVGVNFGSNPLDERRYKNKRSEMWGLMRDWLSDESLPPDIPDDDSLHAELTGPAYSYDSSGRVVLERKEDMRKRGIHSPDQADALALTFAFPVRQDSGQRQSHATMRFRYSPDRADMGGRQARAD